MPSASQVREAEADDESTTQSIRYRDVLNDVLERGDIRIDRYLRFFQASNLLTRSPRYQDDYLKWLEKQKIIIENNPSYTLYDSRRAPRWKSQRTTCIFDQEYSSERR